MESVECLVKVVLKYDDILNADPSILIKILELIFNNMLEIEDEISKEWAVPPDGFNDNLVEDDDQRIIKA